MPSARPVFRNHFPKLRSVTSRLGLKVKESNSGSIVGCGRAHIAWIARDVAHASSSPRFADKFAQRIPPRNRTHRIIPRLVLIKALGVKRK